MLDGAASEGVSLPCQGFARTSGPSHDAGLASLALPAMRVFAGIGCIIIAIQHQLG